MLTARKGVCLWIVFVRVVHVRDEYRPLKLLRDRYMLRRDGTLGP